MIKQIIIQGDDWGYSKESNAGISNALVLISQHNIKKQSMSKQPL